MRVPSLGGEDHLEEGMTPTPVFSPRKFHRRRRSVGYSSWGLKELDTSKRLSVCVQLTHST